MLDLTVPGSGDGILRYSCVESSAGRLLVAMSDHGVVDIILGDSDGQTLSKAVRRFPGVGFVPDRGARDDWVAAVVKRIELPEDGTFIPVDLDYACQPGATG